MVFNTDTEINTDANVHTCTHIFYLCPLRGPGSRDTLVAVSTSSNWILVSKFCSAPRGLRCEPHGPRTGPGVEEDDPGVSFQATKLRRSSKASTPK